MQNLTNNIKRIFSAGRNILVRIFKKVGLITENTINITIDIAIYGLVILSIIVFLFLSSMKVIVNRNETKVQYA